MNGRLEEKRLAEAFDHIDDDDSGFISKEVGTVHAVTFCFLSRAILVSACVPPL